MSSDLGSAACEVAFNEVFAEELALQDNARARYQTKLIAHPDCRDPDHPGCAKCDEDNFPEEWK